MAEGSQVKKKGKRDMDPERRRNSGGKNESRFKEETYLVGKRTGYSRAAED